MVESATGKNDGHLPEKSAFHHPLPISGCSKTQRSLRLHSRQPQQSMSHWGCTEENQTPHRKEKSMVAIRTQPSEAAVRDPVCGMSIDPARAFATRTEASKRCTSARSAASSSMIV